MSRKTMKKKTMKKKTMETIYEEDFVEDSVSMIDVSDSEGEPECDKMADKMALMAEWQSRDENALETLRKAKEETLARRRERALRHYNYY